MKEKKEDVKKKSVVHKRTTNRINSEKIKSNSKKNIEEKNEEIEVNVVKEKKTTTFNLVEVIIIMMITAIFGIMLGWCVAYFKDNVIDHNNIPYEFDEFMQIYREVSTDYYENFDKKEMIESGIKGMIDYLKDPYSSYLDNDETKELQEELEGEYVGIGVTVGTNDNNETVIYGFLKNSPALKAGLKTEDIITKVDGESVKDLNIDSVSDMISGKENTKVTITVTRDNEEKEFVVNREKIELTSVSNTVLNGTNIGYISISVFAKNTPQQFKQAMEVLVNKKVDAVIIDVRNNSGGYLSSAQEIAELFLDKGDIIYQLDTKGIIENVTSSTSKTYDIKTAILINEKSASAAELLATTLNANLDAPLVGKKTYGKGTIQKTKQLSSGARIKYTIQEWYAPNGNRINKVGVNPTYEVELSEEYYNNSVTENDNQLQKAIEILEIK